MTVALTKDRLITIFNERISDELEGLETYSKIWDMIHTSKMPYDIRSTLLNILNEILAEEEIHISMLKDAIDAIERYK